MEEEDAKRMYPPRGDWLKVERWEGKVTHFPDDTVPSDKYPENRRLIYNFNGLVEERSDNAGNVFRPKLFMSVSPDKRYQQEKPTEYDNRYKLYRQSYELYLELFERKPENQAQIVEMLEKEEYTITTMRGNDGPFVTAIKSNKRRNTRR